MAIIKAGTYKFDTLISLIPYRTLEGNPVEKVDINFTVNTSYLEEPVQCVAIELLGGNELLYSKYLVDRFDYYLADEFASMLGNDAITVFANGEDWFVEGADVITVLEDTEVSDEFGVWFDSNVKPQMSASVSITYNGTTTSLETGKTATLECSGKKMKSNIVVSV